jgi:exodeoxyribonuclease VII large subunit
MNGLSCFQNMQTNFVYTVSQINNYSSELLKRKLSNIWVEGEISSLKTYPSGFSYFTLKDSCSELSCIYFNTNNSSNIINGIKVTINGTIQLYVIKGNYQLKVSSLFLKGEGALWNEYMLLKNKLNDEGLFDRKHKNMIPLMPKSIGIITSLKGAVIKDIVNILNRRAPYINIIIKNSQVNGRAAIEDLRKSYDDLTKYGNIDTIIIARGGGSFEDLLGFNDEILVRKIFRSNIPTISAIGHETDFTLCDFVSDLRASTPSEAAELVCLGIEDINQSIVNITNKLSFSIQRYFSKYNLIFQNYSNLIKSDNIEHLLVRKSDKIKYLSDNFKNCIFNILNNYNTYLNANRSIIKNSNINKIKKMGFSISRKDRKVINNINDLQNNDLFTVELLDGEILTQVKEINEKQ